MFKQCLCWVVVVDGGGCFSRKTFATFLPLSFSVCRYRTRSPNFPAPFWSCSSICNVAWIVTEKHEHDQSSSIMNCLASTLTQVSRFIYERSVVSHTDHHHHRMMRYNWPLASPKKNHHHFVVGHCLPNWPITESALALDLSCDHCVCHVPCTDLLSDIQAHTLSIILYPSIHVSVVMLSGRIR